MGNQSYHDIVVDDFKRLFHQTGHYHEISTRNCRFIDFVLCI
uniref:Uncharacterized protein n=1 Tax=Romanomermis culicivorax TaxID=13658 RepID=A0A915JQ24_ROMCU